jgi:hypothetical protein
MSYAAKSEETKGDTSNCGVIGVQIYAEELPIPVKTDITINPSPWYPVYPWGPSWITKFGDGTSVVSSASNYTNRGCLPGPIGSAGSAGEATYACDITRSLLPTTDSLVTPQAFDMGTEFSKQEVEDKVVETEFKIGALVTSISIYYASREALEYMGIDFYEQPKVTSMPNPFPNKFCKPPVANGKWDNPHRR